jgi:2,3-bisphosphoglycerate-independent phosphoglycerate mutase
MKYLILLYDGMADEPLDALGGKTPMQAAKKPLFDALGRDAEVGLVHTVAQGLKPGSDVANLSVLGYDPALYYTGRSPLEAVSMGVPMTADDLTLRCNLVTLSEDEAFASKTMVDYAGSEVDTGEAAALVAAVQARFGGGDFAYYAGVQYRHCLLWQGAKAQKSAVAPLAPPHDIIGRCIGEHLPRQEAAAPLLYMMQESYEVLKDHPVNQKRRAAKMKAVNAIWLWGEGTKPGLSPFTELTGKRGSVISAVDLLKGIGILADMRTPEVPGATGWLDTDYEGKARQAVAEFESGQDFVYLHFEATDEAGHRGNPAAKTRGIELIDERALPIVMDYLNAQGDYALMILPDHPTPCRLMTHTSAPVPYMLYRSCWNGSGRGVLSVDEVSASATGLVREHGHALMKHFLEI